MNNPAAPLPLSHADRDVLTKWARSESAPYRVVTRAKVLLMAGDGVANSHIATTLGISRPTVLNWRARFLSDGLDSVGKVRPGRGRKPGITAHQVQAIVEATLHEKPPGALRALLGHPRLDNPAARDAFGIVERRRARRISVGKFMNVTRAQPLVHNSLE